MSSQLLNASRTGKRVSEQVAAGGQEVVVGRDPGRRRHGLRRAERLEHPDDLVIVVVGEAKEIVPQLEKFGKVTVYDTNLKEIKKEP